MGPGVQVQEDISWPSKQRGALNIIILIDVIYISKYYIYTCQKLVEMFE